MPANNEAPLPSPWKEFLGELDSMLREPLELHCIGGFVFTHFYGLPRTTGDIDYYTAIPANFNLDEVAGQGSSLHTKHGVWLHRVAVANLPEDHVSRLTDMVPGAFKSLRLVRCCGFVVRILAFVYEHGRTGADEQENPAGVFVRHLRWSVWNAKAEELPCPLNTYLFWNTLLLKCRCENPKFV
jgi:hypothetical protein